MVLFSPANNITFPMLKLKILFSFHVLFSFQEFANHEPLKLACTNILREQQAGQAIGRKILKIHWPLNWLMRSQLRENHYQSKHIHNYS